jgi:2-polyprenyl-3-methyl-5-hydroxy-6-metoxy-1,4-benzoquinol methylase
VSITSITRTQSINEGIATEEVEECFLCGARGTMLHPALRDHVFGAPGEWRMVECRHCELAWLDPRPTPADIGKAYATYYTHGSQQAGTVFRTVLPSAKSLERMRQRVETWFRDAAEGIRARRLGHAAPRISPGVALLSRLADWVPVIRDTALLSVAGLPPGAGRRLLDVGCGSGDFLLRMRARGWDVLGVEPDPVASAAARRSGLNVRDGMLTDAAFADDTFDAIVLSHVIEHVHDPITLLRECGRVLRPGGVLVMMTPNLTSVGHRRFGADWRGLEPPRHLHVFSVGALAACVQRVGLVVSDVRTSARMVRGIWWVSRSIQHDAGSRKRPPRIGAYLESWGMSLVEDVMRVSDPRSSEEIILFASKASRITARP